MLPHIPPVLINDRSKVMWSNQCNASESPNQPASSRPILPTLLPPNLLHYMIHCQPVPVQKPGESPNARHSHQHQYCPNEMQCNAMHWHCPMVFSHRSAPCARGKINALLNISRLCGPNTRSSAFERKQLKSE